MTGAALLFVAVASQAVAQDAGGYEKQSYNYSEWAKGRFSEVVTVKNPGRLLFLGGIGAEDEATTSGGAIKHVGDFGAQCRYAWDKIKRILEKQGGTLNDVIKATTFVTDIRSFPEAGKCRGEVFAGSTQPAGTFVAVSQLAWPGMMIEVDVIAATAK
ncbi:hypothetical protein AXW67_32195 [Bradyrhizobium neotropicale]|uniref:Enamine deaminase RidA n=1 Tax=Bradyrhizobium neotropicale TaxID=1497615 RepID=A0A176YJF6_9BRAD|nr:hypothetical protein AXW67_32195 [Bradyrhizobium neotropicale]